METGRLVIALGFVALMVAPLAGWSGRFFHSTNMTFGQWEIAVDATDLHQHRYEQEEVWNVVSGAILLVIDGTERRLEAGAGAGGQSHPSRSSRNCRGSCPCRTSRNAGWR